MQVNIALSLSPIITTTSTKSLPCLQSTTRRLRNSPRLRLRYLDTALNLYRTLLSTKLSSCALHHVSTVQYGTPGSAPSAPTTSAEQSNPTSTTNSRSEAQGYRHIRRRIRPASSTVSSTNFPAATLRTPSSFFSTTFNSLHVRSAKHQPFPTETSKIDIEFWATIFCSKKLYRYRTCQTNLRAPHTSSHPKYLFC